MSIARATQSLAKLGGASLSAIADVFVTAMNMRHNGISWPQAVATALGNYTKSYKGKEKMVARSIGAFVDDIAGEMRIRWDVNEALPGKMAALQDKFFRWSGLNWITETGKAGYAMWFSKHLGEVTGKTFDKLDANRRAVLEYHGIDHARWEALRHMTEKTPDGKTMLVPGRADNIPESVLRSLHKEELAGLSDRFAGVVDAIEAAEKRILDRERQEMRTQVMSMIADETQYAVIEPDAKTKAFMRQGTRPGTVAGEVWRTAMQFKSFPIAYLQREMGGKRWAQGAKQVEGKYDPRGAVGAALGAFAFGYIAMTAKDIAKGKSPRELFDEQGNFKKETLFAALLQSGGAGIFGDFLFGKVDRFSHGAAASILGPLGGVAESAITIGGQLVRGEVKNAGQDVLKTALDNTPFINLWYTREALNWMALYHVREMMSPGTLKRTERKMKEEFSQTYLVAPSQHIKKGGGFK
jgi:hypothetical protein